MDAPVLYEYGYTFRYGDGVSAFTGHFFSASAFLPVPGDVQDQFGRWGTYSLAAPVQVPAEFTTIDINQPPRWVLKPAFSPAAQNGAISSQIFLVDPGDGVFSSANVWLNDRSTSALTIASHSLPFSTVTTRSNSTLHALSSDVVIYGPDGASGLNSTVGYVDLTSFGGSAGGAGSRFKPDLFPTGSPRYDVLFTYIAAQSSGWTWTGYAADNGTYRYFVPNPSHSYQNIATANGVSTNYALGALADTSDSPTHDGLADPNGLNSFVGAVNVRKDSVTLNPSITTPANLQRLLADFVLNLYPGSQGSNATRAFANAHELVKIVVPTGSVQTSTSVLVGSQGLGSEVMDLEAQIRSARSSNGVGLKVDFQFTPTSDATVALEQAVAAALATTTLYDFRFTFADGSYYNGTVADNGLFLYAVGYTEYHTQLNGQFGHFDITASEGSTSQLPGTVNLGTYVDATRGGATFAVTSTSQTFAEAGLGSEIGHVLLNGQDYSFGQGSYELRPAQSGAANRDVNADGTSDILLQSGGTVVDWLIQGGAYQNGNVLTSGATGYTVRGTGDFNGDGTSDVVLQNGGTVVDWIMKGGLYQSGNVITSGAAGFDVVGTGDFNGDGTTDILLQSGGTVVDWLMQGGVYQAGNIITTGAAGFQVKATGDVNGDGTTDIILQGGGTVVDWIMGGGVYQSGNIITTGAAGFDVKGAGDFNGDGTADIVLQGGGTVVDWIMGGGVYQSGNIITTGAAGFDVRNTGDYNGDGTDDIALQGGGTVVDWIMGGGVYQSGHVITTGAAGFTVV